MYFVRGLDFRPDVAGSGRDAQTAHTLGEVTRAALHGDDFPGLRLRALVAEGAKVALGDPVLEDRHTKEIRITAPASGLVETIETGPGHVVRLLTIRLSPEVAPRSFDRPDVDDPEALRRLMLEGGLWASLRQRPYGRIPAPEAQPEAIFVTAIDTEPGAPDPAAVITASAPAFAAGLAGLSRLSPGPVYLCQPPGAALADAGPRIRIARFSGGHPAGMPGTHVQRLHPLRAGSMVWQIGYADVLALGALVLTGRLPTTRTVALGGPRAAAPRLLDLPPGAELSALAAGAALPGPLRVISGSALSGRESRFLRRADRQITLVAPPRPRPSPPGWLSRLPAPKLPAILPHAALDRALGGHPAPVALLRALSIGHVEQARRLGAANFLEEDMALATYLSGGTEDFGARLRAVLDRMEAED